MIRFFNVKDDYIHYLRGFEPKILFNKQEKRPYIGVVHTINSIDYYVPLVSPKPKFAAMKNTKDFHKIAGGKYGAINFNKMIPVISEVLIELDINNEPNVAYRHLLQNQFREIISMKDTIRRKSENIYSLFTTIEKLYPHDIKTRDRCCDFLLLEQKMREYIADAFERDYTL